MRSVIKVKLTLPANFDEIFNIFDNQSVGLAIREAIRSAIRPVANTLKATLKTDLMNSEQSTGATERAVTSKAGRSISNPNVFYGIVGVNSSVSEIHNLSTEGKNPRSKGKQKGIGLTALRTTQVGKSRRIAGLYTAKGKKVVTASFRSKRVFSRYRDKKYTTFFKHGIVKRKPSRYFHLINEGFQHRWGVTAKAYNFIRRVEGVIGSTAQTVFVTRLTQLLVPTMQRQINRNLASATKRDLQGST